MSISHQKVVVLLSSYNGEKYIEQQIESIFNQKDIDSLTLIVRDDGSTDRTLQILNELQGRHNNLEIISGKNKGLVASFFELLNYAYEKDYDYYSFSDQDDYWLPDKLSIAIKAIEGHETPYMYSACSSIVDENLNPTGEVTQQKLREITFFNSAIQNFCPGHNQVLNRQMVKMVVKNTKVSPAIYSHDLWITNVAAVSGTIVFDNTPHTLYRQHGNNQLSFGKSKIEWVKDHVKRLHKSEGKRISEQLKFFTERYNRFLTREQINETEDFFREPKLLTEKYKHIRRMKFYRQRRFETVVFKVIYFFGGYSLQSKKALEKD